MTCMMRTQGRMTEVFLFFYNSTKDSHSQRGREEKKQFEHIVKAYRKNIRRFFYNK